MSVATLASVPSRATALVAHPLDQLRARVAGEVLTPETAGYDAARTTHYGELRQPVAIVRASSTADVAAAVTFARQHDLLVAVRSGGHSLAGYSMVDDALVIDFSAMKAVTVDPATRIAVVQPGATSGDLAGPAAAHGLALSTGDTHSVGMGGLVTGGGVGFMVRKHGLTIDSLVAAEVVTAAGTIVTASETEHPDLFWAIRGGGGNVGIVTEFTFRLAEVPQILGGALILPATREVLRGYLTYTPDAPDDLTTIANVMHLPPLPFIAPEQVGQVALVILVTWSGDLEAGQAALAPLRALAQPLADLVMPMPYPGMYQLTAEQAAPHPASVRMMFADDLSDAALDAILTAVTNASSPMSVVQLRGLGGAYARVAPDATAFAHRQRRLFVSIINIWMGSLDERPIHEAWTDALWATLRPEGQGAYVNFLENEGTDRIHDAYPRATYDRLAAVKAHYDPENVFRFNQNVPPAR